MRTRGLAALLLLLCASCAQSARDAPTGTAPTSTPTPTSQQAALTHEQYQRAIQEILASDDNRAATSLFTDTVGTDYGKDPCTQRVRAFHTRLQAILRRIEELRPPADARDSQRDFLAAAQESVRLVGVATVDVGMGELRCGQPLNSRIYGLPSTQRAQAALSRLEAHGYVILGN